MLALLELVAVVYLPGAVLFRAPVADRVRRAALEPDERAFWALIISIAWSSLVGLALAIAGVFTLGRVALAAAGLAFLLVATYRARLLYRATAARPTWRVVVPLLLVVLGALLFFPSAEHIIGGKDPGGYVNEGVQIARTGSVLIREPLIASVPIELRRFLFPSSGIWSYDSLRFMGFLVLDPAAGIVVGQFPHLYPVWMAIGYAAGGISWALGSTGCWAILGLLAVYFTGRRIVGRAAAAAAALLLAVSVVQIWWAREPNSEILNQSILLAALAAFTRADVDEDRFFAPIAGVLLGVLVFLRLDAVIAIASVILAAAIGLIDRRRPSAWFLVPLVAVAGAGAAYLWYDMPPYIDRAVVVMDSLQPTHYAAITGLLVVVFVLLWAVTRPAVGRMLRPWVPYALVVPLVVGAIYAYFFRVAVFAAGDTTQKMRVALHDAMSLRVFAWYLPAPAIAAAVAGYALIAWRRCWQHLAWFVTVATYAFFFFDRTRVVPEHFWMTRRFVPLILPAALLMLCGLAFYGLSSRRRAQPATATEGTGGFAVPRGIRLLIGVVFVGIVGVSLLGASRPVIAHVEYRGAVKHVEDLALRFSPDDLVLFESRDSSADLHVLAIPLDYVYGRQVLVLPNARPDLQKVEALLEWARPRFRNVYFVGGGGTELASRRIAASPVGSMHFELPEYESPVNAYPRVVRQKKFDLGIYRFEKTASGPPPRVIEVGQFDDLNVVRFYAKEPMGDRWYRWTRSTSYVTLPAVDAGTRSITLWLSDGGRPDTLPRAHVHVLLNDVEIGETDVALDFHPYEFAVPPEVARAAAAMSGPARLTIRSNVWRPSDVPGVSDDRQLGVMMDRVEVK